MSACVNAALFPGHQSAYNKLHAREPGDDAISICYSCYAKGESISGRTVNLDIKHWCLFSKLAARMGAHFQGVLIFMGC